MKNQDRPGKVIMGILSVILWVIILTMFLISALDAIGAEGVAGPSVLAALLVVIGWLAYQVVKTRRFSNRLNDAMLQFMIKRDIASYFSELDALEKVNGNRPIGRMHLLQHSYYDY